MTGMTHYVSRWGEYGERPAPNPDLDELFDGMTIQVRTAVCCSPEEAWLLVSAIERIGEFSPECVAAWWVPGAEPGTVGARFEGRNRVVHGDDIVEWIRPCDVVTFDPPREFAWTTGDRFDGTPAVRWTFRIESQAAGCLIEQEFQHLKHGLSGLRLSLEEEPESAAHLLAARRESLWQGMTQTLQRLRAVLEA